MNALFDTAETEQWLGRSWPSRAGLGFRSSWFSDNLGVSAPLAGEDVDADAVVVGHVLRRLAAVQAHLLAQFGRLSRGGVAVGDAYHDDNALFGPALVEAYRLEWAADTPRIVLSPAAEALARNAGLPLFASEPLRAHERWPLPSAAVSLDFIRAELADGDYRSAELTDVLATLHAGESAAGQQQRYKWAWAIARVVEFEQRRA